MRTIKMASLCVEEFCQYGVVVCLGMMAHTTLGRNIRQAVKPSNLEILSTKSTRWLARCWRFGLPFIISCNLLFHCHRQALLPGSV